MWNKKSSQSDTAWKQIHKCISILFNCKQFSLEYAEYILFEVYRAWFSIRDLKEIQW